ncbi:hypothetical protein [Microbacterium sp. NPDC056052]|uniref:hypothetical protein n=1 Tax=Microbacterium sp. NPDC056052 TaxID=3345695 RepID=UPI0035E3AA8F
MTPPDRTRPNRPPRVTTAVVFAVLATVFGPVATGIAYVVGGINSLNSNATMASLSASIQILGAVICAAYSIALGVVVILTGRGSAGGRIWATILLAVLLLLAVWGVSVNVTYVETLSVVEGVFYVVPPVLTVICSVTALILLWGSASVKPYFARMPSIREE